MSSIGIRDKLAASNQEVLGSVVPLKITEQDVRAETRIRKVIKEHLYLLTEENLQKARDRRDIQVAAWWEKKCDEKKNVQRLACYEMRKRMAKW